MKKDKQRAQQKAELKTNRKKAEKAVKAALVTELTTVVGTFAEPNKKLKKLIGKAASAFAKEIDKTAKPIEIIAAKTEEVEPIVEKAVTKAPAVKKNVKTATK